MKKLALLLSLLPSIAFSQSSPNWPLGYQPSAAEWNAMWASKADAAGGIITGGAFNGTIGAITPSTGAFTTLSASSTAFATLGASGLSTLQAVNQIYTAAMSGASYPPGPVPLNRQVTINGTVTDGFSGPEGHSVPMELSYYQDNLNFTFPSAGGGVGREIQFNTLSGKGPKTADLIEYQFLAQSGYGDGVSGNPMAALSLYNSMAGNFSGATTGGGGLGDFYGLGVTVTQGNTPGGGAATFSHMLVGAELDVQFSANAAGSSVRYYNVLKLGTGGSTNVVPTSFGAFMDMYAGGTHGSEINQLPYGISFGDPQSNTFPITATGRMIGAATTGTTALGIDFSNVTFTTAFLKGPNNFEVLNSNQVQSDSILPPSGTFSIDDVNGTTVAQFTTGGSSAVNFFKLFNATTGNAPYFRVTGSDATVSMNFRTDKGAGNYAFFESSNDLEFLITGVAGAISYPKFTPAASGNILFDVGGTGTGISVGASAATAIALGKSGGSLGFYGTSPIAKATPSGACAGNTGCQALRDALGNLGLINTGSITN